MELHRPLRVVTPTVDGDVLAVLARAEAEFTPPQVHRLIGHRSEAGVRKALERLVEQGVVDHRVAGRAGLYQLNRGHLAAAAITELASLREELILRLRERLDGWEVVANYAALFGSAARGDMHVGSDIDLFLVRPDAADEDGPWQAQIAELQRDVTRWTGNDARVLEYSTAECRDGLGQGDAVLGEIAREGIRLAGEASFLPVPRTVSP